MDVINYHKITSGQYLRK